MASRQTKYASYAALYILIVLGVLAAVNWLANRHNKSYDTTANKRYSLSDQTEKVVKNLKEDVKITYWDSAESFPRAKDLLDRYGNLSGKLTVDYVDSNKKPQLARAAGIRNAGTITVEKGAKREEAKSLSEEDVTGAIIRVLKGSTRTVCFVQGSGERGLEESRGSGFAQAKETLEKNNYQTQAISLLEKPEIPAACTVLAIGGPRFDYPAPAVAALKKSVEEGGRVLFMLDPPLALGKDDISANQPLKALLAGWGVTLDDNLILDLSPVGQMFGLSEAVPLVTGYENHPIVREMKGIATAFPVARSLDVKSTDKALVEKLFSTSSSSFATTNLKSAEVRPDEKTDKKGPLPVGAAGTYNTGKENSQGRFVVVGSSGFIANNILRFQGNRDLFLNMMNWLSSDEDLISIRPKEPEDRRLELTRAQMLMIRTVSQFVLPLIVIIAGVFVWWKRR